MICPVCKIGMLVVERNRIELDYCGNCGGTWFDSGELELLIAGLGINNAGAFLDSILAGPDEKTNEHSRKCPICSKDMKKTTIGDRPKIIIDACRRGHGLWFDGGELNQFLNNLSDRQLVGSESYQRVSDFLKQTLQSRNLERTDAHKK
jgi:Zn-finger nucleic acid-binding protein